MSAEIPHANPIRGRFNSWLLAKFEDDFHEEVGDRKARHIGGLTGTVVEIGAGNGVNFRYYPPGDLRRGDQRLPPAGAHADLDAAPRLGEVPHTRFVGEYMLHPSRLERSPGCLRSAPVEGRAGYHRSYPGTQTASGVPCRSRRRPD